MTFPPPPSLCTFKNPQTTRSGRNDACLVVKVRTVKTLYQIISNLAAQANVIADVSAVGMVEEEVISREPTLTSRQVESIPEAASLTAPTF